MGKNRAAFIGIGAALLGAGMALVPYYSTMWESPNPKPEAVILNPKL